MTLKARVRDTLFDVTGRAAQIWPISNLTARFFRKRRAIIFYHAVWASDDPRLTLFGGVGADRFAEDMRRLGGIFRFVSLADAVEASLRSGDSRPTVSITFDDGFDLVAGGAADILDSEGISATAFVNSDSYRYERLLWQHAFGVIKAEKGEQTFLGAFNGAQKRHGLGADIGTFDEFIGASQRWPQARINALADEIWLAAGMPEMSAFLAKWRPYMDRGRLKEWIGRGHAVGFHGKSHPWSAMLGDAEIEEQYAAPARALKTELGLADMPFAYPFGQRLAPESERKLIESGVFSCLLGADRLSRRGETPFEIDRIEADFGLARHVFGRQIIRAFRKQDRALKEAHILGGASAEPDPANTPA